MSVQIIPRRRFGWKAFTREVTKFAVECGLEEAFPVADDGRVVPWQDHDELTLPDGREVEHVPGDPLQRLQAGFSLCAVFTSPENYRRLACADGDVIVVPDFDEDNAAAPSSCEQRRLAERTECGECKNYAFLISLAGGRLTFQTALMTDANGDCAVEPVAEAGLADEPMIQFIRRFIRR